MNIYIIIILILCNIITYAQNNINYDIILENEYELVKDFTREKSYVDMYIVKDKVFPLKYIMYVVCHTISDTNFVIDNIFQDEFNVTNLLKGFTCRMDSEPRITYRGNLKGYELNIIFEDDENMELPGVLYSTSYKNTLFHIVFMLPSEEIFEKYKSEITKILNTFQLVE